MADAMQGMWRTREARKMIAQMLQQVFEKVYDPATGECYYYNKRTGNSTWIKPKMLGEADLEVV